MTVYVKKAGLTYISVPKCGCSSLKHLCFEIEHDAPFGDLKESLGLDRLHRAFASQRFRRFLSRRQAGDYGGDLVTVIRNPVDRLLSCYTNKVVKALALHDADQGALRTEGLSPDPDFDAFIANLDSYRALSKVVERHSRPLSYFLGDDPAQYVRIFDISDIADFAHLVNTRAGTHVPLQHLHRADASNHSTRVTHETARAIETYMADDYETFGNYMKPSNRIRT